jgi:hypothetical protein
VFFSPFVVIPLVRIGWILNNSFLIDCDTDEETDKLLNVDYRINAQNQAIRDAVC